MSMHVLSEPAYGPHVILELLCVLCNRYSNPSSAGRLPFAVSSSSPDPSRVAFVCHVHAFRVWTASTSKTTFETPPVEAPFAIRPCVFSDVPVASSVTSAGVPRSGVTVTE